MRRAASLLLAACAAAAAVPSAGAQPAGIRLRVVDDSTRAGLAGAEVLLDSTVRVATDSAGRLRLTGVAPGPHTLKASRLGYRPQRIAVQVSAGRELEVELALRPMPLALPEVLARAKRTEGRLRAVRFYERRQRGAPVAWDRGEIDRVATGRDITALLPRLPGFALRRVGPDTAWVVVSTRGPGLPEVCPARVLVDGTAASASRLEGLALDHVAGVEAYPGPATAPAELAVLAEGARCGVIAIWTYAG